MGTWCLRSSYVPTLRAGTPYLELFEPLGRCGVSTVHRHGRGHEEEAGQQSQDEGEPLGIHREGSSEGLGAECNLERIGTPKDQNLYRPIISPCGIFFFGQIARQFGGSFVV